MAWTDVIEPPESFMRQMPPSSAGTIRNNPGQAEGRKGNVDFGSFKDHPQEISKTLQPRGRGIMPALSAGMKSRSVGTV
jgi:hypothetical protein